jgi:hypothetical protein
MSEKKTTGWQNVRQQMSHWPKAALIAVVKDLYEASPDNRDYRKATGNLDGTIDLMLTYVENGTEFTREFGDINESFYNSLESVLNELAQLLMSEGKELYPKFRARVQQLAARANGIGWGYGDALRDQVHQLENELAGE